MPFYCAFCGRLVPPRAKYVIILGHAQDRKRQISEINADQGRSANKYVIFLKMNSPTNFSVYEILSCADSNKLFSGHSR